MTKTITRRGFLAGSVLFGVHAVVSAQQAPTSAGVADPALIEDLVVAYRVLAQQGVLDGFGHVSARHNRAANRFIMSRSLAPELVTAADLIEFDLDGNAVDAKGRSLYSERFIHAEIYRARPDVRAVVHNHAAVADSVWRDDRYRCGPCITWLHSSATACPSSTFENHSA